MSRSQPPLGLGDLDYMCYFDCVDSGSHAVFMAVVLGFIIVLFCEICWNKDPHREDEEER